MIFREHTYNVLVVSASEKFNSSLKTLLPENEYYPVYVAGNVNAAQRELLERSYDLMLINSPLPDDFGLRLAIDTACNSNIGVLLFVRNDIYDEVFAKVTDYGVVTLPKPTNTHLVTQSLRVLCAARERVHNIERKMATIEEKMEEIRIENHAKWLLIEFLKMSEEEAHRYIEKEAMDLRVSKRTIAENIIKTYR